MLHVAISSRSRSRSRPSRLGRPPGVACDRLRRARPGTHSPGTSRLRERRTRPAIPCQRYERRRNALGGQRRPWGPSSAASSRLRSMTRFLAESRVSGCSAPRSTPRGSGRRRGGGGTWRRSRSGLQRLPLPGMARRCRAQQARPASVPCPPRLGLARFWCPLSAMVTAVGWSAGGSPARTGLLNRHGIGPYRGPVARLRSQKGSAGQWPSR